MVAPWKTSEFWNVVVSTYSTIAFVLIYVTTEWRKISDFVPRMLIAIVLCFFLFTSFIVLLDWMFTEIKRQSDSRKPSEGIAYFVLIIFILEMSIFIAVIIEDSNILTIGSTLILVVVTAYYANKTFELTEKQWRNEKESHVIVYLKENDTQIQVIDLIIENVGKGIARNVAFSIYPHGFITLSGDPLERLFFFQNGIQALPPHQKYTIHLVNLANRIHEIRTRFQIDDDHERRETLKRELELNFIIAYEDVDGERKVSQYTVNLCVFWGLRTPVQ